LQIACKCKHNLNGQAKVCNITQLNSSQDSSQGSQVYLFLVQGQKTYCALLSTSLIVNKCNRAFSMNQKASKRS